MNAIEVENLSKRYIINHQSKRKHKSLRDLISDTLPNFLGKKEGGAKEFSENQAKEEEFWALKDINFTVELGDRLAIIGGNGAGKSTLLKILSRITEPTNGEIRLRGRVSSLLEVGTGFHPELTGRENIFLNGAMLGMRKTEIAKKFEKIVNFSGVEKFIDTPVKHYSSGMYVRLAFSVSAWLDPDILIVDEVLSVGDQAFQRRCTERMKELTGDGRTVLFVSHSMQAVKSMCEKALYLEKGKVLAYESADQAADRYDRAARGTSTEEWCTGSINEPQYQLSEFVHSLEYLTVHRAAIMCEGEVLNEPTDISNLISIKLEFTIDNEMQFPLVPHFHFFSEFDDHCLASYPESVAKNSKGRHTVECLVDPFTFNSGRYYVSLFLSSFSWDVPHPHHFVVERALKFEITESSRSDKRRHGWSGIIPGVTRTRLQWNI